MINPNEFDEAMKRLDSTKPVVERDPFIKAGHHGMVVLAMEPNQDQKWGLGVRIQLEYETSTNEALKGTRAVKIYHFNKPPNFPNSPTDADEFADFVCKLQGIPEGSHAASCRALLRTRAQGGNLESQPARGARIGCTGTEVGKVNQRGQRYTKVYWHTVPGQDANQVLITRADLDRRIPFTPHVAQPAAQAYGGYQAPAQPVQQPAPQPYQAPAQYAQPVQQPAPQYPAQGAPAGGFLSLLPPK